ncbi:MAG: hypothetical protein IJU65_09450 [Desulfovibrio sp.]|nr:hypothetical protein [Desulfovibrio sp.]
MSNMENYLRHQDVVAAVKQVLGIPQNETLTTTLREALQDGSTKSTRHAKKAETHQRTTLTQEYSCLVRELPQLRKHDEQKCKQLIAKLNIALQENPAALALVKELAA